MPDEPVVTITLEEDEEMSVDLPEAVAGNLLKAGSEAFTALMADINQNGAANHNLARAGATRRFNELDPVESRSVSGVLATPVASPTTQAGS